MAIGQQYFSTYCAPNFVPMTSKRSRVLLPKITTDFYVSTLSHQANKSYTTLNNMNQIAWYQKCTKVSCKLQLRLSKCRQSPVHKTVTRPSSIKFYLFGKPPMPLNDFIFIFDRTIKFKRFSLTWQVLSEGYLTLLLLVNCIFIFDRSNKFKRMFFNLASVRDI